MTAKRRKVRPIAGQVVAIPLRDGSFALGHVAELDFGIKCALYAFRAGSPEDLTSIVDDALACPPIALRKFTSDEIQDGVWPVIAERPAHYPPAQLDMRGVSYTASVAKDLLDAYFGLEPWDGMYDPKDYEKLLLPGVPVPPTVRYKRDFEAPQIAPPLSKPELEVTEGPGEIHIQIIYPGDELPDIDLLHRRQALEQQLEAEGAGEVTDAGGGGGVMDVYLRVDHVELALPIVDRLLRETGFAQDALVGVQALDDEEDDDDDG